MFSPVKASNEIVEKYLDYLKTIFRINDEEYKELFDIEINNNSVFHKGPYLHLLDSFKASESIAELIKTKELSESFNRLNFDLDRRLYEHQVQAIKKANQNRNLVITTGTGSGKTEAFLIPILNYLTNICEKENLTPGIRAMIIYPMNALANDQVDRLREVLKDYPEITFGSFIGQTPYTIKEAKRIGKISDNTLSNELVSREQMLASPPHILITNYSMLEYLLIRPQSSVFFDSEYSSLWKYIVLDEAHVYHGSTGIEVSMLIKRLKARLDNKDIQFFLTSATLGTVEDNPLVIEFAENLCSATFEESDIIRATRVSLNKPTDLLLLEKDFYRIISTFLENNQVEECLEFLINDFGVKTSQLEEAIFELVTKDRFYWKVRERLVEPKTVQNLANSLDVSLSDIEEFVDVASKGHKNNIAAFDSRYHMFIKATESVYITLGNKKKVFFEPRKKYFDEEGGEHHVFEIAICQYCNQIYIINAENNGYLTLRDQNLTEYSTKNVYLLNSDYSNDDTDDEDISLALNDYNVCSKCGKLSSILSSDDLCEHGMINQIKITRVHTNEDLELKKCVVCNNRHPNQVLRAFYSGQEAVSSVLSTALYESIPASEYSRQQPVKKAFSFSSKSSPIETKKAKQFIAFSDSRQQAAYFSSYLDETHKGLLYRRIIRKVLDNFSNGDYIKDLIKDVSFTMRQNFTYSSKDFKYDTEAAKAVYRELAEINNPFSLSNMGQLKFHFGLDEYEKGFYDFTKNELEDFVGYFSDTLLSISAFTMFSEYGLSDDDYEFFTFNPNMASFTFSDSDYKKYIFSFIPTKLNGMNKRYDYFSKVFSARGLEFGRDEYLSIMSDFFDALVDSKNFVSVKSKSGFQINTENIRINNNPDIFKCDSCKKITNRNISDVCPTYKCNGKLHQIDKEEFFMNNHYYKMYESMLVEPLIVHEHTAQLKREKAEEVQKDFIEKKINVLSCSTTFEMGVDIGSLETVFMRNVPPTPANYAQRAGRAGRNKKTSAYALTLCNKNSHDFTYFKHPEAMIKGSIHPPIFNKENDQIAIRHVYATALSEFWREFPEFYTDADNLVEEGFDSFKDFLEKKPPRLMTLLTKTFEGSTQYQFDFKNFGWIDALFSETGPIQKTKREYQQRKEVIENAISETMESEATNKFLIANYLNKRLSIITEEKPISLLSHSNLLPRYGFPVDTVDLKVEVTKNIDYGIEINRDLSVAISEFAPESQVIANNKLITSRYINKYPKMNWQEYAYQLCSNCGTTNIADFGLEDSLDEVFTECYSCNKPLQGKTQVFITPIHGFVADTQTIKNAGIKKPKKTYRTEVSYTGYIDKINYETIHINKHPIKISYTQKDRLTVLNNFDFYVCKECGYGTKAIGNMSFSKRKHKKKNGSTCYNEFLNRYSLGYILITDVLHVNFRDYDFSIEEARSILYGVIEGICHTLDVDRQDINGTIASMYDKEQQCQKFNFIFYDTSPGGSGFVKKLYDTNILKSVFEKTYTIMSSCTCGGEAKDTACYSCLQNYYNQKYHYLLQRNYVIDFFENLLFDEYVEDEDSDFNNSDNLIIHSLSNNNESSWNKLISYSTSLEVETLLQKLRLLEIPIPIMGYEFEVDDYIEAELLFEDSKIACLTESHIESKDQIEALGYTVFRINDHNTYERIKQYYGK